MLDSAHDARARRGRTRFVTLVVLGAVLALAAITLPRLPNHRGTAPDLGRDGVATSRAGCSEPTTDPVVDNSHSEAGTRLNYAQAPPSSGRHWPSWVGDPRVFYTERTRPRVEQLVHNLEHGYTIIWYDETLDGDQRRVLRDVAERAAGSPAAAGKLIVTSWDDMYGTFPEGKHIGLSHWGAVTGHRQLCAHVSGEVIRKFIARFPASDSPEPAAPGGSPREDSRRDASSRCGRDGDRCASGIA